MVSVEARFRGSLLGLAAGDALGTTVEFSPRGSFEPLTDMVGGGPFHLEPGQWTDDTSMALCLAESIVEVGWDPVDQLDRYVRWRHTGHLSSNGVCFDIGNTVRNALSSFEQTREPRSGPTHPQSAGNGSIMRLAPVALRYATRSDLSEKAAESSRTTHGAATAVDACRYLAALVAGAVAGRSKQELLCPAFFQSCETREIAAVAAGSFGERAVTRFADPATSSSPWKPLSGRSTSPIRSRRASCSPRISAMTQTPRAPSMDSSPVRSMARRQSQPPGERAWRCVRPSRRSRSGSTIWLSRMPEPIVPDSYWVTDDLAGGEYPGAKRADAALSRARQFEDAGVTLFVDLTHPADHLEPYEEHLATARRVWHPIVDNDVPTVAEMQATLDTIDGAHAAGDTVYVHCWGGIGRTGTVIACWLVRHGSSAAGAIELIRDRRRATPDFVRDPLAPQTRAQRAFVEGWPKGLDLH